MAVSLGKRKRTKTEPVSEGSSEDEEEMRNRFQRAFEAKFRPLDKTAAAATSRLEADVADESSEDAADASDWDGLSDDDDDDDDVVHVVDSQLANGSFPEQERSEQRAFMSSKPPTADAAKTRAAAVERKRDGTDDATEAANLKHDLALRRLLKESHLLDPGTFGGTTPVPEGKGRLKALDLRLQDLGARGSLSTQDKMPIAHRKGITAKAVGREEKRRHDAAENGVILEKARHAAKDLRRRERGIGGPTVGRFRGGTLKLSGKDVRDIQGRKGGRR